MYRANATLTFKIAIAGAVTRDPVTGTPIQATETVVVQASMEAVSNPNKTVLAGVDESALYLEGRSLSPKYLTSEMRVHKVCDMTLQRGENVELRGKFYLLPFSSSRLALQRFYGDFLNGFFQVGG